MTQTVHQSFFGFVPQLIRANSRSRSCRNFVQDVVETEIGINSFEHFGEVVALGQDLVFGAKNVTVVLGETAHAHDAVQTARRLVAVALAKFAIPQWQVTVALHALLEDQDVPRTVHRLQRVIALFRLGGEHVVTVLVPVTGFFPERFVQQLGTFDLLVATVAVDLPHVLLNGLPNGPAFGMPKHQAWRVFIDVE